VDDVRERCRWSGTQMALSLTSHDVLEQRARGHLASTSGTTSVVTLIARSTPFMIIRAYSRLTLRGSPSTSPRLHSPRSRTTASDQVLSLPVCTKLSFPLTLTVLLVLLVLPVSPHP
jgi:hypothetical protein